MVSGINLSQCMGSRLPESPNRFAFTAHERIVGHDWEVRNELAGIFESGKTAVQTRTYLSGNYPRY